MKFERYGFGKSQYNLLNNLLNERNFILDFSNRFVAEVYDPTLPH
jgi:hypothetical protein